MCVECASSTRRRFLSLGAAGIVAAGLGGLGTPALASTSKTPDEALAALKAGNERFVTAPEVCALEMLTNREKIAEGQAPWATILGCSDSRVAPELVFGGINLGELFVCRNAGNTADPVTMGTIEYGSEHLGSPLIVVLGHERCGAVQAACEVAKTGAALPGSMGPMVAAIVPVARELLGTGGDLVDRVVRESARRTAQRIATESEIVAHLVAEGRVKVVYAHYDLDSGVVTFLD